MVEERTVSNFTKINSADRAKQKASTIVNIQSQAAHTAGPVNGTYLISY